MRPPEYRPYGTPLVSLNTAESKVISDIVDVSRAEQVAEHFDPVDPVGQYAKHESTSGCL